MAVKTLSDSGRIPATSIGIGLHAGEAVSGNIGSPTRQQYSISGNVVILASRIEQLNKELGSRLLVSASVAVQPVYRELRDIEADRRETTRKLGRGLLWFDTNIVDEFHETRYSNTGGFVQAQFSPTVWMSLTAGTRADYNSRFGATFNPRIGAVLNPRSGTTAKLLFGTAYLAPSPYQESAHYGSFYTTDGGQTWQPRNQNVRADFNPDVFPEFGQCVHKMELHPSRPDVLFQQNHCGVYRSDNCGDDWIDIGEGRLPSRFGFPIAVHPKDPQTVYIALEDSDQFRMSVDGQFSVWRSRNAGESWEQLTNGLPNNAHLVVLREAMTTDSLDRAGVYAGTDTGQLFYSRDDGDSWEIMAEFLPPILSVETAVIE